MDNSILHNNFPVLFLTFASIILAFRGILSISSLSSSNFIVLPGFIVLNYFIMTWVENINSNTIRKSATLSVYVVFIFIIGANFANNYKEYSLLTSPIKSSKGVIYSYPEYSIPLNQAIKYVKDNTTKSDTVLTIPDEVIINFMSGINSPSKFYQFLPCYNEAYYQPIILSELKRNNPKFIIISNNSVGLLYNGKIWGVNYNKKLSLWIYTNYSLVKTFSSVHFSKGMGYKIYLYEKKQIL